MTYRQAGRQAAELLRQAGIEEYETDAALLLREAAGFDMTRSLLYADEEMPASRQEKYMEMIRRRAQRVPIQHITGYQTFMGYDFSTGPQALIPRQDTEVLVTEALQFLKARTAPAGDIRVLDVCTGTGCIVESLALEMPGPCYIGSDISTDALELAAGNARSLSVEVELLHSDLLTDIPGQFDLIVSNPPYIPEDDIPGLDPEVRDHDPHLALSGGRDGLEIYRKLIPAAFRQLREDGGLMLEIGAEQAEEVSTLLAESGFEAIRIVQDPSGHDRVAAGFKLQQADSGR